MNSHIGVSGQMFVDGRDLSRLLSALTHTAAQGNVDNTRMRTPARFRTHAVTLNGGSLGFTGDLPDDNAEALVHSNAMIGHNFTPHIIMQAPFGADVGRLVRFGKSLRNNTTLGAEIEGILSLNAEFEKTAGSPGVLSGLTLFSPNLEGNILNQDEIVNLVFSNADPNQFFAVRAVGTSQIFQFEAGVTNAALKAGIEGLTAYAGRTVTITGAALTGTTTKSGTKTIEWDGAVDVPNLEVLQGELHTLQLNNATAAKTIYGNVSVPATGGNASTIQSAVQAKGGDYAQVTVTKTGTDPSALYAFAYPVGANPVDMIQPTVASTGSDQTGQGVGAAIGSGTGSHLPAEFFDNDTSGTPNIDNWVGWDFGVGLTRTINGIRLFVDASQYPTSTFRVDASNSGAFAGEETIAFQRTSGGNLSSGWNTFTFSAVTARAFRLVNTGGATIVIPEIEFVSGAGTQVSDPEATVTNTAPGAGTTVVAAQVQQGGTFDGVNIVSATTTGATVQDNGTTTTTAGGLFSLQSVLPIMGTSTWKVQHAQDNAGVPGTWVDLLTFDDVTGQGAQVKEVPAGTPIYPYLRARCTAITGSAQVAIGAARR